MKFETITFPQQLKTQTVGEKMGVGNSKVPDIQNIKKWSS